MKGRDGVGCEGRETNDIPTSKFHSVSFCLRRYMRPPLRFSAAVCSSIAVCYVLSARFRSIHYSSLPPFLTPSLPPFLTPSLPHSLPLSTRRSLFVATT